MSNRITVFAVHGILLHYILNYIHVSVVLFSNYCQGARAICVYAIHKHNFN